MRAREFIKEEKGFVSDPGFRPELWSDGGGGGTGSSMFRDLTGVNLPPDDIIAASIAAPAGQQMNMAGLTRATKPSLATRVSTGVKDATYDVVNKPSPYNPLTYKDIGTERGTARYHADRQFRKETGREPPTSRDIGNRDVDQQQLRRDTNKLSDLESSLLKRGYGRTQFTKAPEIGANVNAPIPTRTKKYDPKVDFIRAANKTSLDAARLGAATALDITRDQREKRNREGK